MFSMAFVILAKGQCQMSASINNVTCCGMNNGAIDILAFGGTAPYNIAWTGPVSGNPIGNEINSNIGNYIISNLLAGFYTISLTDANGCITQISAIITEPACLIGSVTSTNCLCFGDQSGSITITSAGGVAPYDVSWSGSVNGNPPGTEIAASGGTYTINSLPAGNYAVAVTDATSCQWNLNVTITQPSALVASSGNLTQVVCFGAATGGATITATNGTAPYNVSWSGPVSGDPAGVEIAASGGSYNITNLTAGTYTVSVTDANNCTTTTGLIITEPSPLNVTGITSNNGIDITVNGGTAPYTYVWSTGTTTEDLTNLMPGTYTVTVTDANGCTQTDSFTIQNAEILTVSPSVLEIYPNPACDKLTLKMKHSNNVPFYIADNLGRTVIRGTSEFELTEIPIDSLKAGIYLLHIDNVTLTFVKE
jgi:uncharacterized protein (DUF2141 family)